MYCDAFERVLKTNHLDSELPDIYNLGEETMEEALKKD